MTSVSQFAQYLLKLDPQRNTARLTLFNFVKHVLDSAVPFTPAVIQNFYARVLQFEHWQSETESLANTVRTDLHAFVRQHLNEEEGEVWQNLRHSDSLQIVHLKLFEDLEELIQSAHVARQKSGHQIKCVRLSETQVMALILAPGGGLEVKIYPNMALVWGAALKLAAPITHLHYSADLELLPDIRQVLEGSLLTTHCFHVDMEGVHGLITRGHTFQKFETFIRAKLSETQDLFYSLKKLERHFINPQSDPFYQDLVGRLERANRLLNHPSLDNLAEVERTLNRGRLCLKNIFPNDRLLGLLITHLDYAISQRRLRPSEAQ
ncbi:MAG: hypothetical protein AB7G93_17795 [Bdellovibrionales bacterium]